MDNTINNLSFRANIKSLTKINNKRDFIETKKIFENRTKNDSNYVLYITDGVFGYNKLGLANSYKSVFTKDINEQINSLSTAELAQKLVKIFRTLKKYASTCDKNKQLESKLNRAETLLTLNQNIAKACESGQKIEMAKRFGTLANRNKDQIDALNKEITNNMQKFNDEIDTLSGEYEELSDLKFEIK